MLSYLGSFILSYTVVCPLEKTKTWPAAADGDLMSSPSVLNCAQGAY